MEELWGVILPIPTARMGAVLGILGAWPARKNKIVNVVNQSTLNVGCPNAEATVSTGGGQSKKKALCLNTFRASIVAKQSSKFMGPSSTALRNQARRTTQQLKYSQASAKQQLQ